MRIVHAVHWSRAAPDAAIEQTVNTADALARQGAEVTLLAPRGPGDPPLAPEDFALILGRLPAFAIAQCRVPRWALRPYPALAWWWCSRRAPAARQADVVLSRMPETMVIGAGRGRRFVVDQFRTWPDNLPWLRAAFRRRIASRECLGLLLHSDYAARSFLRLGVDPGKVLVAHNGADPERFATARTQAEARARLDLPATGPIAVFSGRLMVWKGVATLLDLARARPGVLFVLAGSHGEGPIEAAVRDLANVRILTWLRADELAVLYRAADLLLLPPSRMGLDNQRTVLPIKTYNYLAAGKPILAPRLPDTEGLLVDGQSALLVEPDDLAAALAGLDRLLADSALAEHLGSGALALAHAKTWDARAKLILTFLEARLASET